MYKFIYWLLILYLKQKKFIGKSKSFLFPVEREATIEGVFDTVAFVLDPNVYCYSKIPDYIEEFEGSSKFSFAKYYKAKYDWYEFNKYFGILLDEDKINFQMENKKILGFRIIVNNTKVKNIVVKFHVKKAKHTTCRNFRENISSLINDMKLLQDFMDASAELSWRMIFSSSLI
ncbi:MAG: hypothetical protein NC307_09830 [Roseburia sp.]|nr:hypothetical protein [Roseburia sp.]